MRDVFSQTINANNNFNYAFEFFSEVKVFVAFLIICSVLS